jgi:hypothetical protein
VDYVVGDFWGKKKRLGEMAALFKFFGNAREVIKGKIGMQYDAPIKHPSNRKRRR